MTIDPRESDEAAAREYANSVTKEEYMGDSISVWYCARNDFLAGIAHRDAENARLREALRDALGHSNCYCAKCKATSEDHWSPSATARALEAADRLAEAAHQLKLIYLEFAPDTVVMEHHVQRLADAAAAFKEARGLPASPEPSSPPPEA